MSTRQMAEHYRAGSYGRGGGGGGTSLIDLLTGNTPRKLQESSQMHEKEMMKLADELANNEVIRNHAKNLGIDPKDFAGDIARAARTNALTRIGAEGNVLKSPGFQSTLQRGMEATNLIPEVNNRRGLSLNVPQGGTGLIPPDAQGKGGYTVRGATPLPTGTAVRKQVKDEKGNVIYEENMPTGGGTSPGNVMPLIPPEVRQRILQGNKSFANVPENNVINEGSYAMTNAGPSVAPVAADRQGNNSNPMGTYTRPSFTPMIPEDGRGGNAAPAGFMDFIRAIYDNITGGFNDSPEAYNQRARAGLIP